MSNIRRDCIRERGKEGTDRRGRMKKKTFVLSDITEDHTLKLGGTEKEEHKGRGES